MISPAEKYRIIRRLGQQQRRKFGDVFLVEDKVDGTAGVMKTVAKTATSLQQETYLREEASFDFRHPQLPATLYQFESEHELVVVRSYFPGIPLNEFAQTLRTKQKPAFLLALLQQLQPVFEELDKQRVLHLDIKPSNIIINGTPDTFTAYLIDFGISVRTGVTNNRSLLFPLGYAAPELLLNQLHLADRRTDIFALGIVFWQVFTGKLPLLHTNPSITTNLQLTHPLPEHSDIPKRYYDILKRMSAKHAFAIPPNRLSPEETDKLLLSGMEQRYSDISEIIRDWEIALAKKTWFGWK